MYGNPALGFLFPVANHLPPGTAAFFVLLFAMLVVQLFWVCELTYAGWKEIPGAICLVPPVVPVCLVVSKLSPSLVSVCLFIGLVFSDDRFRCDPGGYALDGIATSLVLPSVRAASYRRIQVIRGIHIRALRFRLFCIFSVSIATTLASLVHAVLVVVKPGVWEAIFGTAALGPLLTLYIIPNLQLTADMFSSFIGGVSAAVAIIVCSMSVIIPAVLRALGVGDPFMQEDTVDPNFSTIEMARATSTGIELGLPTTRGTAITDSDESEETVDAVASLQRHSVNLYAKGDWKHQLTTQVSDGSLKNSSTTKAVPLADESSVTDSSVLVKSLLAKLPDTEVDVEDKDGESDNT